jgi:negative regulator of replication initiation
MKSAKFTVSVDESEAAAFIEYCRRELILPEDWLRRAAGLKVAQPFLVAPPYPRLRSETSRMLAILEDLWKKAPESFASAAKGVGGNSRLWFATDPSEIWASGSSNKCAQIGTSPWWVSTNCPWNGMTARIDKVMLRMGFSARYTNMVSGVVVGGIGSLWAGDYVT